MHAQAGRRYRSPWAAVVVVILTVLWTIPTFGLFVTSLRPSDLSAYSGWWTVFSDHTLTLDNYREVLQGGESTPDGLVPYLVNSIAIAVPATIFPITLGCMAAYVLAWIPFRGATTVLLGVVALQVVPVQMALQPLVQLFNTGWSIGPLPIVPRVIDPATGRPILAGTYGPLWIAHTMFMLPLVIVVLQHFMARLPREVFDAARVDGASHSRIFLSMAVPLSLPAIASMAIFLFLWIWNDLLVAITFTSGTPDTAPVTAYLAGLEGAFGSKEYLLTAGAFVAIAIPLVVFFTLQRYFARGLLAGSVEG
ncbi:MAG TPA: carbohydrate ABC transporter permease [Candidatus Nanopelagicales bacterium]|nr:carbohydrate ABC transporter permease [Candidatus Nanopelagicales bacterium]